MFGAAKEVRSKPVSYVKGGKVTITIDIKFASDDIHLNEEAPNRFQVKAPPTMAANVLFPILSFCYSKRAGPRRRPHFAN
jgi:hypothetical protein